METQSETLSTAELKARGNEAYQRQDFAAALEFWNKALHQFVDGMQVDSLNKDMLGEASRTLEKSLYLNLAQGYLKIGEPERALRACLVVLHDGVNSKALFRAAEACLALKQHEKAVGFLEKLLHAEPEHAEAKRLLHRVEVERRTEAKNQKAAARRMLGAVNGISDVREAEATAKADGLPASFIEQLESIESRKLPQGMDIAEAAASAARQRYADRNGNGKSTEGLQQPSVIDLDAFRAKEKAKTQRMSSYMDRSRKQRANAGHRLKLAWLRSGQDAADLGGFQDALREEAKAIEALDLESVEANRVAGDADGMLDSGPRDNHDDTVEVNRLEEMD